MLHDAYQVGVSHSLEKHGLAAPTLKNVGINTQGLPPPAKMPKPDIMSGAGSLTPKNPITAGNMLAMPSLGKAAAQEGMAGAGFTGGAGATRGEPADVGRRQRSVIDRAWDANERDYATSSMPLPGSISP